MARFRAYVPGWSVELEADSQEAALELAGQEFDSARLTEPDPFELKVEDLPD